MKNQYTTIDVHYNNVKVGTEEWNKLDSENRRMAISWIYSMIYKGYEQGEAVFGQGRIAWELL